jgi:hypothetical protein
MSKHNPYNINSFAGVRLTGVKANFWHPLTWGTCHWMRLMSSADR